ncbi:MAG: hypothetical protein IPM57_00650 [Oligoflexia bacterium]|nr:hypothetical protein [Oligoflexia bacterium]
MSSLIKKIYNNALPVLAKADPYYNLLYLKSLGLNNKEYENLKIAFVKQEIFPGLYCCSQGASAKELVFSSLKHSGPVGLFTKLKADFITLKEDMSPECQIWTEVVTDCGHGSIEEYRSLKTKPYLDGKRGHKNFPGQYAISAESIDWSKYDAVISVNIAVPEAITEKYPQVVWCYLLDHPTMTSYKKSQVAPIKGYDLFFNIRFRANRFLPRSPKWHEIDWPFNLQYYGCFHEMLNIPLDDSSKRSGIFIESHTQEILTKEQLGQLSKIGPLHFVTPDTENIIKNLLKAKYFVRFGGRTLWGNGMIEAVAAGSLFLGDASEFVNRGLFTPQTTVKTFDDVVKRILEFEKDSNKYLKQAHLQRKLLNELCFERPFTELYNKRKIILSKRKLI